MYFESRISGCKQLRLCQLALREPAQALKEQEPVVRMSMYAAGLLRDCERAQECPLYWRALSLIYIVGTCHAVWRTAQP